MTATQPEQPGSVIQASRPGLWAAILAVQSEAPVLPRDKRATVQTRGGGQYGYRYTDLATLNEKLGPLLRRHGLVWSAKPTGTVASPSLSYKIVHVPSGECDEGEMPLFGVENSQGHGSAITYGRRYSKVAVLDLIAEDDDDGVAASGAEVAASASSGVDMRDKAKGLNDAAINAARQAVGLPKLERPWGSLVNIPAEKQAAFAVALDNARLAQ